MLNRPSGTSTAHEDAADAMTNEITSARPFMEHLLKVVVQLVLQLHHRQRHVGPVDKYVVLVAWVRRRILQPENHVVNRSEEIGCILICRGHACHEHQAKSVDIT